MKKYFYVWNDHLMLRGTKVCEYIIKAITEHDWETFCIFRKILDEGTQLSDDGRKMIFFPDVIYKERSEKTIPLNKKNFKKISWSEYECG